MIKKRYQPEITLDLDQPESLHLQLRQAVIQDIFRRRPQPGTPFVSERQLAEQLQLNRNTVHRAMEFLIQERILSREPGKREVAVGAEASLRVQPAFPAIGILLPAAFSAYVIEHPVYLKTRLMYLTGLFDRAGELGYAPMPLPPGPETGDAEAQKWIEHIQPRLTAVIHLGDRGLDPDPLLDAVLHQSYLPQVAISCVATGADGVGNVSCDLAPSLVALAQLLLERGRRRLGVIGEIGGGNPYFSYEYAERTDHALNVFRKTGLELRDDRVLRLPENTPVDAALETMFRSGNDLPDALWCSNDLLAAKVYRWLAGRGISVPGQVALIGTDDIGNVENLDIALTSIKVPMYAIGRAAIDLGLEYYFHGHTVDNHRRELPATLVLRQST